ncbi:hypothetical protein VIGAN_02084800 [Vigna angularis var. angularis]|uniref:Uncharacterized protein n=1 Tax=Vigna angularis var. angularis TaxID=157739 RepID=A0A0S3RBS2_PHAAN|nr:hypothetical protein VIGAN_02084800 [Vigna angularis var. angularis]
MVTIWTLMSTVNGSRVVRNAISHLLLLVTLDFKRRYIENTMESWLCFSGSGSLKFNEQRQQWQCVIDCRGRILRFVASEKEGMDEVGSENRRQACMHIDC